MTTAPGSPGVRAFPARCVVDASVLVKLFLPEEDADLATTLLQPAEGERTRYVPDLAYLECANIFWKWVRRSLLPAEFARVSTLDLLQLPLQAWPGEQLTEPALDLALRLDVTVYDAAYLALAHRLGIALITADAALQRKASSSNLDVRLLQTYRQGSS